MTSWRQIKSSIKVVKKLYLDRDLPWTSRNDSSATSSWSPYFPPCSCASSFTHMNSQRESTLTIIVTSMHMHNKYPEKWYLLPQSQLQSFFSHKESLRQSYSWSLRNGSLRRATSRLRPPKPKSLTDQANHSLYPIW